MIKIPMHPHTAEDTLGLIRESSRFQDGRLTHPVARENRLMALGMVLLGVTVDDVAALLKVTSNTIEAWITAANNTPSITPLEVYVQTWRAMLAQKTAALAAIAQERVRWQMICLVEGLYAEKGKAESPWFVTRWLIDDAAFRENFFSGDRAVAEAFGVPRRGKVSPMATPVSS